MAYEKLGFAADCLERHILLFEEAFPGDSFLKDLISQLRDFATRKVGNEEVVSIADDFVRRAKKLDREIRQKYGIELSWIDWDMGEMYGDPVHLDIEDLISEAPDNFAVRADWRWDWMVKQASSYFINAALALFSELKEPSVASLNRRADEVPYLVSRAIGWFEGWKLVWLLKGLARTVYSAAQAVLDDGEVMPSSQQQADLYLKIGNTAWEVARQAIPAGYWEEIPNFVADPDEIRLLWEPIDHLSAASVPFHHLLSARFAEAQASEERWQELHRELLN